MLGMARIGRDGAARIDKVSAGAAYFDFAGAEVAELADAHV